MCLLLLRFPSFFLFFILMLPPLPISTLFPYTTLFRSLLQNASFFLYFFTFCFYPFFLNFTVFKIFSVSSIDFKISAARVPAFRRSEEHTSELQSRFDLVFRLLLEKKNK